MLSGVGGIGLGLALIAVGYGLAPTAGSGLASPAVGASMRAEASAPGEGPRERLPNAGRRDAPSGTPGVDRALDDSRECDADKGIAERCVYN